MKKFTRISLPFLVMVFLVSCAAPPPPQCNMKSSGVKPELIGEPGKQFIFEIHFEGCNEFERSMLAKNEIEIFMKERNFEKYQVVDTFVTKRYGGKLYRVIYSRNGNK